MKKFIIAKFLDFKIVESKDVVTQVQELQLIIPNLHAKDFFTNYTFHVATIIEKLTPLWKDFKIYLKNKHKKMCVEDIIVRMGIEEDKKETDKRSHKNFLINGVNNVEDDPPK